MTVFDARITYAPGQCTGVSGTGTVNGWMVKGKILNVIDFGISSHDSHIGKETGTATPEITFHRTFDIQIGDRMPLTVKIPFEVSGHPDFAAHINIGCQYNKLIFKGIVCIIEIGQLFRCGDLIGIFRTAVAAGESGSGIAKPIITGRRGKG